MDEIKALTLRQPWAHCIAHLGKQVENRSWPVRYRGLLAIHAGAGWDAAAERDLTTLAAWRDWSASLPHPNVTGPLRKNAVHVDFGAVIAVAELAGCHHSDDCGHCSAWSQPDSWHWLLRGVRPLRAPVPCKGKLGLWRLPEHAEKGVREQLEVTND